VVGFSKWLHKGVVVAIFRLLFSSFRGNFLASFSTLIKTKSESEIAGAELLIGHFIILNLSTFPKLEVGLTKAGAIVILAIFWRSRNCS
jgi:hypothetical protein